MKRRELLEHCGVPEGLRACPQRLEVSPVVIENLIGGGKDECPCLCRESPVVVSVEAHGAISLFVSGTASASDGASGPWRQCDCEAMVATGGVPTRVFGRRFQGQVAGHVPK